MEWSNATLSCAYDCLFTILRNVYINNHLLWIANIKDTNRFITMLTNGWETDGHVHEVTCDKIHELLNLKHKCMHGGMSILTNIPRFQDC